MIIEYHSEIALRTTCIQELYSRAVTEPTPFKRESYKSGVAWPQIRADSYNGAGRNDKRKGRANCDSEKWLVRENK